MTTLRRPYMPALLALLTRYRVLPYLGLAVLAAIALTGAFHNLIALGAKRLALEAFQPTLLALSFAVAATHRYQTPCVWSMAMRTLGWNTFSLSKLRHVYLLTEIARFLPGLAWNYSGRVVWAVAHGAPSATAAGCQLLELLTLALSAGVVGMMLLIPHAGQIAETVYSNYWSWAANHVGLIALAALAPSVLTWMLRRKLKTAFSRLLALSKLTICARTALVNFLVQGMLHLWMGSAFYILCVSHGQSIPWTASAGAAITAWLIGLTAIFAPGGLVVREGALVALIAPWVEPSEAFTLAITWRVVQTLAEFLAAAAAMAPVLRTRFHYRRGAVNSVLPDTTK